MNKTLFDLADGPLLTAAERKRLSMKGKQIPRGHAYFPGTGPEGKTCGDCLHCTSFHENKRWSKCKANSANWTRSRNTDIRKRDAACKYFAAETQGAENVEPIVSPEAQHQIEDRGEHTDPPGNTRIDA